jgi:N-acetylmannosamine kinase
MNILAIDIGGTMIKYGLVSSKGEILSTDKIKTEAEKGLENILEKIDTILKKCKENDLVGIAVSGTGQINGMIGEVIGGAPIIPNWIGCNLVEILEKRYNLPAILENDVNCMALGEKWIGSGKDLNNFICLTIGTGIGGGIILNNELFRGENFVAGEFGHILIKKGEFQDFASTTALIRLTREKTGKILNGEEIFNLEKQGLIEYKNIIAEWIENLTDGLSSLVYCFNPKYIILGGGVIEQGDYLIKKIEDSLSKKIGPRFKENLNIKQAKLGNNAGMIGAAYLLLEKINQK